MELCPVTTAEAHRSLFHSHPAGGSVSFSKTDVLQPLVLEHVIRFGGAAFKATTPLNEATKMGLLQIQQGNLDTQTPRM